MARARRRHGPVSQSAGRQLPLRARAVRPPSALRPAEWRTRRRPRLSVAATWPRHPRVPQRVPHRTAPGHKAKPLTGFRQCPRPPCPHQEAREHRQHREHRRPQGRRKAPRRQQHLEYPGHLALRVSRSRLPTSGVQVPARARLVRVLRARVRRGQASPPGRPARPASPVSRVSPASRARAPRPAVPSKAASPPARAMVRAPARGRGRGRAPARARVRVPGRAQVPRARALLVPAARARAVPGPVRGQETTRLVLPRPAWARPRRRVPARLPVRAVVQAFQARVRGRAAQVKARVRPQARGRVLRADPVRPVPQVPAAGQGEPIRLARVVRAPVVPGLAR
jgi:hypothetical protein